MTEKDTIEQINKDIDSLSQKVNAQPTQADLEYVKTVVARYVEGAERSLSDRLDIIERTIEALEKQIATLSVAFGEQAVLIEALTGQIQYANEEEREAFHATLKEKRQEMLNIMKEGADVFSGDDPTIATALEDLAKEHQDNSSD